MRLTLLLFFPALILFPISSWAQALSASFFFETNQAGLSPGESEKLVTFLKSLDTVQASRLSVITYCDDRGSGAYNKGLSWKRANFMKQAISSKAPGMPVEAEGKGELPLGHKTDSTAERSRNRRADIHVTYTLKQNAPAPNPVKQATVAEKPKAPEKKAPILSDDQKVGDKITLENILFAGGRHILLPESYESLENLKNLLLEKQKYHIMILGHICCITSGEDGMDFDTGKQNLSVARARAVYNYLVENGVSAGRLSYKGMRAKYPTGKSDREDRRVEIEITKIVE